MTPTSAGSPVSGAPSAATQLPVGPTAGASPLRTTIQRRTSGARPAGDEPGGSPGPEGPPEPVAGPQAAPSGNQQAPAANRLPVLPVVAQRLPHEDHADEAPASTSLEAGRTMPASSSAAPASLPLASTAQRTTPGHDAAPFRPLVGSRPLRGTTPTAQRSGPAGAGPASAGAEARRGGSEPVVSRMTSGGPASWLPSASPAGTDAAPSEPLPGFAPWGPAAGRSAAEASTDAWSTLAAPTEAGANRAAGTAGNASPATRPLAVARSIGPSSTATPLTLAIAPAVARSAAGAAQAGAGQPGTGILSAASAPSAPPSPVLAPTATAVVQRIEGAPPAAPADEESGEQSDNELDELARKLFGRFRNQLRYEYIYEREAKGLTFDIS